MRPITARRASFAATRVSRTNCGPMTDAGDFTEDAFLGGQLRLRQPKSGHRAGHDAVLLAAATAARPGDRVVEFGAGVGAAGLALARRVGAIDLVLIEIDAQLADLARDNVVANAIPAQVLTLDVTAPADAFVAHALSADGAVAEMVNPPFDKPWGQGPYPARA